MTPTLKVRNLEVVFHAEKGLVKAADRINIDLFPGRTTGLVGESGCGKTITSLALLRLLPNSASISGGAISLGENNLLELSEKEMKKIRGDRISMIFQEPMTSLNPVFTIGRQVAEVFRIHRGMNRRQAWRGAVEMLGMVGIPDPAARAGDYPHQLSGGMRQRAMIAMALACRPDVLIADEPTTALDVTIQAQILDLILEMQRDLNTSVLFISHDLGVVSEIADDVMVMYAGKIVEKAPAASFFDKPLHPYGRGLVETLPKAGEKKSRLPAISGSVPDLSSLPSGCRFSDRCPLADSKCAETDPDLVEKVGGRWVACLKA